MEEQEVYSAVREDGFERLVAAFYRQIPGDDVLGPLYSHHDLAGAEKRLREFLIFRFGGPPRYTESRGHPRLRMRHARFPIGIVESARWVHLMGRALDEAQLSPAAAKVLTRYFESTAAALINHP